MLVDFLRNSVVRNTLIASTLAVPAMTLTAETATAHKSNFWIYNNSSLTIRELYISASSRTVWDNDILGSSVLLPGDGVRVLFGDPSPSNCLYDIRAIFTNGQVLNGYQVDVCNSDYYNFVN